MSTELPSRTPADPFNPYAPPTAAIGDEPVELGSGDLAEAEAIRRAYLGREASIKSIGSLYFLGAIFGLLAGGGLMLAAISGKAVVGTEQMAVQGGIGIFYLFMSGLQIALGVGLGRLQPWARWTAVALITISLMVVVVQIFAFTETRGSVLPLAIGMLIGGSIPGYMLYLLLSSKARTVFSPEYREIVAQTPHIKHRTSIVVKVLLGILLALILLIIVAAMMRGMS